MKGMRPWNRLVQALGSISILFIFNGCQPKEVTSAKIYINNNDWEKAEEQLKIAVQNDPENAEAHFLLGQAYGNRGRYDGMNHEFEQAAKLSQEFLQGIRLERERHWIDRYNAGIMTLDKHDYERAVEYFLTAILIDPQKHEAHKKLALCYLNTDKLDNALFVYNRLLEEDPTDLDLLISVANLYYTQHKFEKAVTVLQKALEIEPDHRDALANLALAYDSLGKMNDALDAFENAIKANPLDNDLIFLFGVHQYKRRNYAKSIELFERVLELHPDEFEATANIGNAYLSMAENVRKKLQKANNGDYTAAEIQRLRNQVILNYKRAIPYLEKALQMQPDHPNLWRNLGVAYINTAEKQKGEEAFLKSEELKLNSLR